MSRLIRRMSNQFLKAKNHIIDGYTKAEEDTWKGPYSFIFATDPQPGLLDVFRGGNGSKWDVEIERVGKAVAAINQMQPRPKFLAIGGDIVHAFPGTKYRSAQVSDLEKAFSTLSSSIPIFIVSGNHDVGDTPTCETMATFRREFGDEYYSFWAGGVFYIAMNSQCIINPTETEELAKAHEIWLESQLESAKHNSCTHVVMFMHIPLFVGSPDEEKSYFSIPRQKRLAMLERFAQVGIKKVFSGHYHRSGGGTWTNDDGSATIEVVVSSALGAQLNEDRIGLLPPEMELGNDRPGICVVKVTENEITHHYYNLPDIPTSVTFP